MFRAEEAEYERQLRAAKVPDQVTVSRVVVQVWKEGFGVATEKSEKIFPKTFSSSIYKIRGDSQRRLFAFVFDSENVSLGSS